jgi:hypothetical protein
MTLIRVSEIRNVTSWSRKKPLAFQFLALFSHVQNPNILVVDAYSDSGWQLRFRHLTSTRAEEELSQMLDQLANFSLTEEPDKRSMRFGPYKHFSVEACYYAMNFRGVICLGNEEIWNSLAPKKCKKFGWLALRDRLSTKERLARRGIASEARCPFGCPKDESLSHLLFSCPHTSFIWHNLQVQGQHAQGQLAMQEIISRPRPLIQHYGQNGLPSSLQ